MGLLDKTNPNATRSSIIRWTVFGAIVGPLYILLRVWSKVPVGYWWIVLPAAMIFGGAVGAIMEWQLDDGPDEGEGG